MSSCTAAAVTDISKSLGTSCVTRYGCMAVINEANLRALCSAGEVPCFTYTTPGGGGCPPGQVYVGISCCGEGTAPTYPVDYFDGIFFNYAWSCVSITRDNTYSAPTFSCGWDLQDCDYCRTDKDYFSGECCPGCGEGCWCDSTAECNTCNKDDLDRLDITCAWSPYTCETTCTDPCSPGTYWDGTTCSATILQKGLSFVRHALTGRLYVAYIDSNNLKVDIYTDAQTDTVGSTVTVDASGNCTAPRIICREDGVLEIIYITGTNVKITQSRDSGTTWAVATTIVTSGYQLATYGVPATMSGYSIIPVMLWNDSKWYVKVGVKTGASTYTFSSAVQVVASAAALPGTLLQRKDGVWEFLYTALPNTKTIIRCRALRSDGTGTWS